MQRMARAASFGRRRDRAKSSRSSNNVFDSDDEEDARARAGKEPAAGEHDHDRSDDTHGAEASGDAQQQKQQQQQRSRRGVLGAVRSVSFSRRGRRKGDRGVQSGSGWSADAEEDDGGRSSSRPGTAEQRALRGDDDDPLPLHTANAGVSHSSPSSSAHDDGHGDGGYGGSGSGSRSVYRNGDHHSGPLPTAQGDVPAPGSLHGWLHKRHTHEKSMGKQWAKRYFAVDEHRGTLAYSKTEFKRPTVVLPLCDITSVHALDMELHGPFCFKISCPPVHLTVRSDSVDDRRRWIRGLEHHAGIWRAKNSGSVAAAVSSTSPNGPAHAVAVPVHTASSSSADNTLGTRRGSPPPSSSAGQYADEAAPQSSRGGRHRSLQPDGQGEDPYAAPRSPGRRGGGYGDGDGDEREGEREGEYRGRLRRGHGSASPDPADEWGGGQTPAALRRGDAQRGGGRGVPNARDGREARDRRELGGGRDDWQPWAIFSAPPEAEEE